MNYENEVSLTEFDKMLGKKESVTSLSPDFAPHPFYISLLLSIRIIFPSLKSQTMNHENKDTLTEFDKKKESMTSLSHDFAQNSPYISLFLSIRIIFPP